MLWITQQSSSLVSSNESVPLKEIHVDARVHSFAADVTLTQIFENDESIPIEAVYCFPVEENGAIYSFIARIDDEREIVAELKEKKQAQKEYTQAIAQGHGAYLFEQDKASNDVFVISIGALKPKSKCRIRISYVSELDLLHSSEKPTIRFVIPTTIAPRYSPVQKGIAAPGGTEVKYTQSVPYTIQLNCQVHKLDQHVVSVSSPSHPIKVDISNEETFPVTFSQEGVPLDRDIIIDIELSKIRTSTIAAVEEGAMMISFMPNEQKCQEHSGNMSNEFLFVIDCSGSMAGSEKIGLACKAMLLFLKSLPVGCRFNIIRFGSSFSSLFDNQVSDHYNEKNMCQAESLIKSMKADLGGTELLEPFRWLKKKKPSSGCMRQIFLLTDGEVSNVDELTDLCHEMAEYTRIFSFGLGHSPSRALVKGLARATNGRFTFIPPNTNVDIHVAEQLARALHPSITDISVKWSTSQTILHKVPEHIPSAFVGDRLLFYALLNESMPFDHATTVEVVLGKRQQSLGMVQIDHIPPALRPKTVTRLAAKAFLRDLEQASKVTPKECLVDLSIKYGILCPHTAFIGVERRLDADADSNTNMELREVAIMPGRTYRDFAQRRMFHPSSHAPSPQIDQLQCDVDNVRDIVRNNLMIQLDRGEHLSYLESRTDELQPCESQLKMKCRATVGSILQPAFGFVSSLFTRKSAASPVQLAPKICHHHPQENAEVHWPLNEQQLIELFIESQKYDGLWVLTDDDVKQLTGKSMIDFTSSALDHMEENQQKVMTTTALVIAILQTRCVASKTLWQTLSTKAYNRLIELLEGDQTKIEQLIKNIRDQLL